MTVELACFPGDSPAPLKRGFSFFLSYVPVSCRIRRRALWWSLCQIIFAAPNPVGIRLGHCDVEPALDRIRLQNHPSPVGRPRQQREFNRPGAAPLTITFAGCHHPARAKNNPEYRAAMTA